MNVKGILNRACQISVGLESVDDEEMSLFLGYLNSAAQELYDTVARIDRSIHKTNIILQYDEVTFTEVERDILAVNLFETRGGVIFNEVPFVDYERLSFLKSKKIPVFTFRDKKIYALSDQTKPYDAFIEYTPQFQNLIKESNEEEIPFAAQYHELLVYGTLYHIYQDDDGFKSSTSKAVAEYEWKRGMTDYYNNLFNTNAYVPCARI